MTKKTTKPLTIRQGDVLLTLVAKLPDGCTGELHRKIEIGVSSRPLIATNRPCRAGGHRYSSAGIHRAGNPAGDRSRNLQCSGRAA